MYPCILSTSLFLKDIFKKHCGLTYARKLRPRKLLQYPAPAHGGAQDDLARPVGYHPAYYRGVFALRAAPERLERRLAVRGCENHLEEQLVDLVGRCGVHLAVGDQHAAESRDRIARQGVLPCFQYGRPAGDAAGVVVLHDDERGLRELADQTHGR
mgnify:CR=1 FL=1